jgi:dipeptidyl-peptidase-4
VTLHVIDVTTAERLGRVGPQSVQVPRARVVGRGRPLHLPVLSRDQRTQVLTADDDGPRASCGELSDQHWLDLIDGSPSWLNGSLVSTVDADDTHRLRIGQRVVTPPGLRSPA